MLPRGAAPGQNGRAAFSAATSVRADSPRQADSQTWVERARRIESWLNVRADADPCAGDNQPICATPASATIRCAPSGRLAIAPTANRALSETVIECRVISDRRTARVSRVPHRRLQQVCCSTTPELAPKHEASTVDNGDWPSLHLPKEAFRRAVLRHPCPDGRLSVRPRASWEAGWRSSCRGVAHCRSRCRRDARGRRRGRPRGRARSRH